MTRCLQMARHRPTHDAYANKTNLAHGDDLLVVVEVISAGRQTKGRFAVAAFRWQGNAGIAKRPHVRFERSQDTGFCLPVVICLRTDTVVSSPSPPLW